MILFVVWFAIIAACALLISYVAVATIFFFNLKEPPSRKRDDA